MKHGAYTRADFDRNPLMFYYEVTQACDLVCQHCRASAQIEPQADELTGDLSRALIDQVASFPRVPTMVMTGGDPLKRADIFELIAYATEAGIGVALTPSATPLATREAFAEARRAGATRLGISLDGACAETHDAFRGWSGSFERTLEMLENARELGMSVQVNTSLTERNVGELDALAELLEDKGIAMWAVFFLVPVGRGVNEARLDAAASEAVFAKIWEYAARMPYAVKTTEAPHYRRYVMQQGAHPHARRDRKERDARHRAPLGVGDGRGIMFVSYNGEIYPAGFLPLVCGRFPEVSVVETYQSNPTFVSLRDPDGFHGKCGVCQYRQVCGGSRSRAYAVTGDPLAAEPDCAYEPAGAGVEPALGTDT